jgi:hypothetical protein
MDCHHSREIKRMKRIRQNCIIPSAAFTVPKNLIRQYQAMPDRVPEMGDLIFGEVAVLGHHTSLESTSARIHTIHDRTQAVFVFGNRYAPDHYEGFVPDEAVGEVDLLARGGIVGSVHLKNELISGPTQVRVLGYVCDKDGKVVNTRDHILLKPRKESLRGPRARISLCIGTSMNSGKSHAAAACCYGLSSAGKTVRAAKVTGTASLKDILLMEDCGAQHIADFGYFGYPSTYMLSEAEVREIFMAIDRKYGNNPKNYLVLEFADGIFQRETAMLLRMPEVRKRIHKLIFCAFDSAGVAGGLRMLKEDFDLVPDAISGRCSSSPLALKEVSSFTQIPIMKSMERDFQAITGIIE